jgi:hypothetical protein
VKDRRREALVVLIAAILGAVSDSILGLTGALSFPVGWGILWLAPLWMVALWTNFAMTLNLAMGWLEGRYALAAAVGGIGGTAAYAAGDGLGSLVVNGASGFVGVGLVWAASLPLLVRLNEAVHTEDQRPCSPGDRSA